MPVTVSLVEGHHDLRGSFARLLNGVTGLSFTGIYRTAEEAVQNIPLAPPDVALVDLSLPGQGGLECVAGLKARLPDLRILMLTLYENDDLIFRVLCAGAGGFLPKYAPAADLIKTVRQVHAGGTPMSTTIARKTMDFFCEDGRPHSPSTALTRPEQQILERLARGEDGRETGKTLGLNPGAFQAHLGSIYQKLHLESARNPAAFHTPRA